MTTQNAETVAKLRELLTVVAKDEHRPCKRCGVVHMPRPSPDGRAFAPTWAAEDGHPYQEMTIPEFVAVMVELIDGDVPCDG
jgi:hypothetical protein